MKCATVIGSRLLILAIASSILLASEVSAKAKDEKRTLVSGTGEFVAEVERTTVPLDPPCVSLLTRAGNVAFSGLIENALEDGWQEVRGLRNACTEPVHGTAAATFTLENATVAGRTGTLILEGRGIFEGDATDAAGARPRYHITIRGVSGDLKGATGTGQILGQASATTAFDTYYAEIRLPH